MHALMPRKAPPKAPAKTVRAVASTNPNTSVIYARAPGAVVDALDAWAEELNAAAEASFDRRRWTRNDVINAILARRLKEKQKGDAP